MPEPLSTWPSTKARQVLKALYRIGWTDKHGFDPKGSHRVLIRAGVPKPFIWAFHDSEEIGPKMLARIAKHTGLKPEDL